LFNHFQHMTSNFKLNPVMMHGFLHMEMKLLQYSL